MRGHREHVTGLDLFDAVSRFDKGRQITDEGGRLAGHVDELLRGKLQQLGKRFGMDSVTRRIENDQVRAPFQLLHFLQHVTRDEGAVIEMIQRGILSCRVDRFGDDLDPADFFRAGRGHDLCDRAGSAVQVEHFLLRNVARELTYDRIQFL